MKAWIPVMLTAPALAAVAIHLSGCGSSPAPGFTDADASGGGGDEAQPEGDAGSLEAPFDAGAFATDAGADAGTGASGGTCGLGAAASFATNADLDLFGQIVYYEDGGALPKGRYRAKYVGGCMKYDFIFDWQVQASARDAGGGGFWFVGDTSDDRIVMAPGATMSYADFDACVAASLAIPAEEFDFDGGKIGVWLNDNPYQDNVAGEDGGNPKWQLTLLGTCPPNIVPQ
jgi:hypothetical protein